MSYAGDLTPTDAWALLTANPAAVLIDVRTQAEWRFVGTPDTSTIGREPLFIEWQDGAGTRNEGFIDALTAAGIPTDAPLVFLCRSGVRSIGAATAATEAGFAEAYNVLEGFEGAVGADGHRGHEGWRAAGLPWRQA